MVKWFKIVSIILSVLVSLGYYFVFLPPINLSSMGFYVWLTISFGCFIFFFILFATADKVKKDDKKAKKDLKVSLYLLGILGICFAAVVLSGVFFGPLFNAKEYHERITVVESNFSEDVKEADFTHLPLLDKDSSSKLGDRVLGQLPELISQFEVSDEYTQINYLGNIVRVTPLEYNGFVKYLNNRNEGVPGYISVNSTTGNAQLHKLEKGMRYMPSAYLFEDLMRHVRFGFPFDILGDTSFEIDEEGNPFWIIQTIQYKGIGLKKEVSGIIVVDPISGEMVKYTTEDIPSWIDNVWDAALIEEQLNSWGKYGNGFLNAYMGQKGVKQTTDGYNYLAQDDDVFMYTGVTSAAADESNIGFVLVNLRTKEARYYAVPGAEEYSAMDSATGQVPEKNYTPTFPLLINLDGQPTYMLSLKDAAGLVKMYAFVDVQDYQKVTVTDSSQGIENALKKYYAEYKKEEPENYEIIERTCTIAQLNTMVVEGNSYLYFKDEASNIYRISIQVSSEAAFLKQGDILKVKGYLNDGLFEVTQLID